MNRTYCQFLKVFSLVTLLASTHFLLSYSFPLCPFLNFTSSMFSIPLQVFFPFSPLQAKFSCLAPACELAPNSLLCVFAHHKPCSCPPAHTHTTLDSFRKSPALPFLAGPPLSTSSCWPPRSLSPAYFLLTFAGPPNPIEAPSTLRHPHPRPFALRHLLYPLYAPCRPSGAAREPFGTTSLAVSQGPKEMFRLNVKYSILIFVT